MNWLALDFWISPLKYPFSIDQKIHFSYLLAYLMIAYFIYVRSHRRIHTAVKDFWSFCFPKSIYWAGSAKTDYSFFYISRILFLFIAPFMLSSAAAASLFAGYFSALPKWTQMPAINPLFINGVFTLVYFLAVDLALFITHYLAHKIPFLWEFHKVHHSALVLTPMTVYRMHPVDDIFSMTCVGLFAGFVEALFGWIFPQKVAAVTVFGFNAAFFVFYLTGYHLRHSHIWLSYGPVLSHIFISPAQHQIHHGKSPEFFDKNFGFVFAFWDISTRSLFIPKEKMSIEIGLSGGEDKEFSGAWKLLYLPFVKIFKKYMGKNSSAEKRGG